LVSEDAVSQLKSVHSQHIRKFWHAHYVFAINPQPGLNARQNMKIIQHE